jgi:nickel-dependent lactate racemase
MLYYAKGALDYHFSDDELKAALFDTFNRLGPKNRVLAVPPDITRFYSYAGPLTCFSYEYYKDALKCVLPAIGTHTPMTKKETGKMYPGIPSGLFKVHDWRNGLATLGRVPADYVAEVSGGAVHYDWPAQVDKELVDGNYDLILSIGQVVPHEVIGMANYNKNIFVGTGGSEGINKSHFLGAAYGMEKIMGRADTPVRKVLNYASDHFAKQLPIVYVQTVVGKDENGKPVVKGLYIGDDAECFTLAAAFSLQANFIMLEKPLQKIIVYLEPEEFKSTWLGNKSIYRTRMAIADNGELVVLAPGLKEFGEDKTIDKLIRKYGYVTTPEVLRFVAENEDLRDNLSAAAHLIHGSSEGRFTIRYCPGAGVTKEEIESVNFSYGNLSEMLRRYDPDELKDGYNILPDGEEIFYISNPALGLWAWREKFKDER